MKLSALIRKVSLVALSVALLSLGPEVSEASECHAVGSCTECTAVFDGRDCSAKFCCDGNGMWISNCNADGLEIGDC